MSRKIGLHGLLGLAGTTVLVLLFSAAAVGAVTAQPVEVSNAQELQNVSDDLDADYVLVDDIDLSGTQGHDPIGECGFDPEKEECVSQPFNGSFDGNGHVISNLTAEREDETDVGLFGAVGEGGSVESLGLEGVSVTGNGTVAGLVGTNHGEVADTYVEGSVEGSIGVGLLVGLNRGRVKGSRATGTVEADRSAVGGLVGSNDGDSSGRGLITGSRADVEVNVGGTGTSWVGGLVGANFGGEVRDSRAEGDVRSDASEIGGLVGANIGGEITRTRAEGDVRSNGSEIGGLVGLNDGKVVESQAEGDVTGGVTAGGLVGRSSGGEIDGSVVTGAVSGNDETGGIVGVLGDKMLDKGTVVYLRNSRWEADEPDLPTVAVVEEGEGEVVTENVTPPVERTAENGDGAGETDETNDDTDGETDTTTEDASTEEGLSGFTLLTALLALLTVALFARKVRR